MSLRLWFQPPITCAQVAQQVVTEETDAIANTPSTEAFSASAPSEDDEVKVEMADLQPAYAAPESSPQNAPSVLKPATKAAASPSTEKITKSKKGKVKGANSNSNVCSFFVLYGRLVLVSKYVFIVTEALGTSTLPIYDCTLLMSSLIQNDGTIGILRVCYLRPAQYQV